MRIYFIIPVYNTEMYLKRCVDSVLKQTYKNASVILVDDGSADDSPRICDEYAANFKNVYTIHKKNGGLSDARNAGLAYAESIADPDDYITFLDSDDFVADTFSEHMISLCENNNCELGQCGYEKGNSNSFKSNNSKAKKSVKSAEDMLLDRNLKSQSWAKIYKLKLFKNIRFPIGVLNEDEFTTYRVVYGSKKIVVTTDKLYYYFQHDESIMKSIEKNQKNNPHMEDWLKAYRERIDFFTEKNKPEQVQRTYEKICTDAILRYCERKTLKKRYRDDTFSNGRYIKIYRENFPIMIKLKSISFTRRIMYNIFYVFPFSAVIISKLRGSGLRQ